MIDLDHLNDLTPQDLHDLGSLKWSTHPQSLPAWVAEMDFGCAPPIMQALHKAVDTHHFGYLPPTVTAALAESCSTWMQRRLNWEVPPAHIRQLSDVLKAFELTIEHFTAPGSAVIVPTPCYAPFLTIPPEMGRQVVQVPMRESGGRWVLDPDDLDAALAGGAGLVVICDPHNPTGTVYTAAEHASVAEVVERHGARVFADLIHAPVTYPGHPVTPYASVSPAAASHTVSAISAAKGWNLAGLKAAQIVFSNQADADHYESLGTHAKYGASTLGMIASTAAYSAGGRWLEQVVAYLDANRTHVVSRLQATLPQARLAVPESTYFVWIDLGYAGLGAGTAAMLQERAGVSVTDGALAGDGFEGWVRINFATPRQIIDVILDRIIAAAG
ncbi:MalY/PatB family protein [Kineosporia succinea]|uniref:cysteine-S-conjugate beta-lyase n=1 Tax=Kineosporia succinea TaxID=84632 RepID=A0ABT9PAE6_9ACTN|nr:aminotransferase class I/II-fold pyridoxal phosphate-dependent enzyme [Kineosporia succinea]MDP9829531.1 cystathionine beta-lyase [Kineosporia succinea]